MHSKAFPYSKPFRLEMKNAAFEFSLAHDIDIISRHVVPERAGGKSFKRKRKLSTKESIGRQNVREATNQWSPNRVFCVIERSPGGDAPCWPCDALWCNEVGSGMKWSNVLLHKVTCGALMWYVATCHVMRCNAVWCHLMWWVFFCVGLSCDVMSDAVMWSDAKWCHGSWLGAMFFCLDAAWLNVSVVRVVALLSATKSWSMSLQKSRILKPTTKQH